MNKRGSCEDHRLISIHLNKRGQFFILSAVIIAAIIVSITSLHNTVTTADAPKKFYYYSQQLSEETGSVVNYALYSDPTGGSTAVKQNLNDFLQQGITKTLQAYPDMEIFACYSNATVAGALVCQNNGTKSIKVNTSTDSMTLNGTRDPNVLNWTCSFFIPGTNTCFFNAPKTVGSISIDNKNFVTITIIKDSRSYNVPLDNSSIRRGQFYFIATLNTTGGEYVSQSNDPVSLSQ